MEYPVEVQKQIEIDWIRRWKKPYPDNQIKLSAVLAVHGNDSFFILQYQDLAASGSSGIQILQYPDLAVFRSGSIRIGDSKILHYSIKDEIIIIQHYGVQMVFDKQGTVVGVYHKYNLWTGNIYAVDAAPSG